jgi:MoxR-like ATPase
MDVPTKMAEEKPLFQRDDLAALQRTLGRVPVANHIKDYVVRIYRATHATSPEAPNVTRQYIRYGASPRGAQALMLAAKAWALLSGRFNVAASDIQKVVLPVMRHRIIRNFEAEAANITTADILGELMRSVSELPAK